MLAQLGPTLDAIAADSGVPKEILLAIWGMETDYGHDSGGFNLFAALATLGYDGPRTDYAKPEFLAALKILQEQNYAVSDMKASWAGAFGQTQFTPTAFLQYAGDGDHDGQDRSLGLAGRRAGLRRQAAQDPRLEARPALGL